MAPNRRVRRLSWPSRNQPEEGFTLVEVLVAFGVIFATLLLLAFSMFSSFAAVGFSRQRTQASALANQTLERIRALPFDVLYMSKPDVAGGADVHLQSCSKPSGYCFLNTPTSTPREVPVATFGSNAPATPFFNPAAHDPVLLPDHIYTPPPGSPANTTYTVKSYVSIDLNDSQTRIVTVQVSWTPAQVGGVLPSLQVESKIFTSPFSENQPGATTTMPQTTTTMPQTTTTMPQTHTYTANAQSQPGTISVNGTILDLNAAAIQFNLPTAKAYLSGNTSTGTSTGPIGHLVTAGTASSGISAGVTVLNTPGAAATATSPAGRPTDGPNSVSAAPGLLGSIPGSVNQCTPPLNLICTLISGSVNAQVNAGSVTSAAALAASSAAGTPNIPTGSIPSNNLGFGRAAATQSGPISANLGLTALGLIPLNLGLVNLVPLGNTAPDTATVSQNGSSGAPSGQTFTAAASKSFTSIDVLTGLPLVGTLIHLQGFSASASACAGPGSCAGTPAPTPGGTLTIAGLAPIALSATPVPINIGVPPVNVATGILNIGVTGSVTIGASTTSTNGSTSTASVTSPLKVNLHLGISSLLGTVVDVTVVIDLGTVTTTASYS